MQDVENLDFLSDKFIGGFVSVSEDCGIIAQKKRKWGSANGKKHSEILVAISERLAFDGDVYDRCGR